MRWRRRPLWSREIEENQQQTQQQCFRSWWEIRICSNVCMYLTCSTQESRSNLSNNNSTDQKPTVSTLWNRKRSKAGLFVCPFKTTKGRKQQSREEEKIKYLWKEDGSKRRIGVRGKRGIPKGKNCTSHEFFLFFFINRMKKRDTSKKTPLKTGRKKRPQALLDMCVWDPPIN